MNGIHGGDIYRNKVNMDFSVNINPLGMPDTVEHVLRSAVERCSEYPDIEAAGLKTAVSNMLNIPKDYLVFGNGASEIFMGIVHALRLAKTVITVPSFYGYKYATQAVESDIVYFPLKEKNEFLPDEELLEALTEDIDIVWLANPNNPTGKMVSKEYLKKLFNVCREKQIYVVLDECFIEFCGSEYSMLSDIEMYENVLIVRAFTKIYAIPGVRLGYLVCSNEYVARTVGYVKKEREFLTDGLKKLGVHVYDSDTDFVLIYSEKPLYDMLLRRSILIRDCSNYEGLSEGFYRIAVKCHKENEQLLRVIGDCIEVE